ncbi:hypothetical protein [Microbacterium sp. YJN-G]|uniref:hypothetical protein n=1 Tax=Microbacterium sp. YJN-G TaxID=2763257 RepID=UPI001878380D|nr:hypothetical protein [Microbacterium sp. YJN-G]
MTLAASSVRAIGVLSTGLLALGMLAACAPAPEPEPEPTETALFSSDEEAFAAAEETYRAYTDAQNDARQGDADPNDYLVGSALEGAIDGKRALEEAGLQLDGSVGLAEFRPIPESIDPGREELVAIVCLDLTALRTLNDQGEDVTPANRPDVIAMNVTMRWTKTSYMISEERDEDNAQCAA